MTDMKDKYRNTIGRFVGTEMKDFHGNTVYRMR
jgi:hypothetical protein